VETLARIRQAGGDPGGALEALDSALRLAARHGQVRVFTDEGAPMAALLTRLAAAARTGGTVAPVPAGHLARVQRSFAGPETAPPSGAALIDALTAREAEVLGLMAAGMSNPAIAAQLVVGLDTVEKHVSHILGKLGASNRTEAVTRGRDLGLSR
jgi:LuxR family maltose regulon positive regulatory protein